VTEFKPSGYDHVYGRIRNMNTQDSVLIINPDMTFGDKNIVKCINRYSPLPNPYNMEEERKAKMMDKHGFVEGRT
jgi:hypothetical protein